MAKETKKITSIKTQPAYMGFGWRMIAQVIDLLLMGFVFSAIMPLFNLVYYSAETLEIMESPEKFTALGANELLHIILPATLFQFFILASYAFFFWIFWGTTPGKRLFSMYVVDAKTLKKASTFTYFLRVVGYLVSMLTFGLGFLGVHFSAKKQGLHDYIAGTTVIERRKK
jgi:uncharacterized RDD family membrane protein YckC